MSESHPGDPPTDGERSSRNGGDGRHREERDRGHDGGGRDGPSSRGHREKRDHGRDGGGRDRGQSRDRGRDDRGGGGAGPRRGDRAKRDDRKDADDETHLRSLSTMDTNTFRTLRDNRRDAKGIKIGETNGGSSSRRRHRGGGSTASGSFHSRGRDSRDSRESQRSGTTASSGSTPLNGNFRRSRGSRTRRVEPPPPTRYLPWQAVVLFGLATLTAVKTGLIELKLERSDILGGEKEVDLHNFLKKKRDRNLAGEIVSMEEHFKEPNVGDSKDWGSEAGKEKDDEVKDSLAALDKMDGGEEEGGGFYSKANSASDGGLTGLGGDSVTLGSGGDSSRWYSSPLATDADRNRFAHGAQQHGAGGSQGYSEVNLDADRLARYKAGDIGALRGSGADQPQGGYGTGGGQQVGADSEAYFRKALEDSLHRLDGPQGVGEAVDDDAFESLQSQPLLRGGLYDEDEALLGRSGARQPIRGRFDNFQLDDRLAQERQANLLRDQLQAGSDAQDAYQRTEAINSQGAINQSFFTEEQVREAKAQRKQARQQAKARGKTLDAYGGDEGDVEEEGGIEISDAGDTDDLREKIRAQLKAHRKQLNELELQRKEEEEQLGQEEEGGQGQEQEEEGNASGERRKKRKERQKTKFVADALLDTIAKEEAALGLQQQIIDPNQISAGGNAVGLVDEDGDPVDEAVDPNMQGQEAQQAGTYDAGNGEVIDPNMQGQEAQQAGTYDAGNDEAIDPNMQGQEGQQAGADAAGNGGAIDPNMQGQQAGADDAENGEAIDRNVQGQEAQQAGADDAGNGGASDPNMQGQEVQQAGADDAENGEAIDPNMQGQEVQQAVADNAVNGEAIDPNMQGQEAQQAGAYDTGNGEAIDPNMQGQEAQQAGAYDAGNIEAIDSNMQGQEAQQADAYGAGNTGAIDPNMQGQEGQQAVVYDAGNTGAIDPNMQGQAVQQAGAYNAGNTGAIDPNMQGQEAQQAGAYDAGNGEAINPNMQGQEGQEAQQAGAYDAGNGGAIDPNMQGQEAQQVDAYDAGNGAVDRNLQGQEGQPAADVGSGATQEGAAPVQPIGPPPERSVEDSIANDDPRLWGG